MQIGRPSWAVVGQAVAAGCLLLLVGIPLGELFAAAFADGVGSVRDILGEPGAARPVVNTLATSAVITLFAVAGGVAAAFVTERSAAPGRSWLRGSLIASLLAAPLVSALGWARAYGRAGLLDKAVGLHWDGL